MANKAQEVGYVHPSGTVTPVPSAHKVQAGSCGSPDCDHIHLFLLDQAGQPFAEATLDRTFTELLIEAWRRS